MCAKQIHKLKIERIRKSVIEGDCNLIQLAKKLNISRESVWKYRSYFEDLRAHDPAKLHDKAVYPKRAKHVQKPSAKNIQLQSNIAHIYASHPPGTEISVIWRDYISRFPDGYQYIMFIRFFKDYAAKQGVKNILLSKIEDTDRQTLAKWRAGNNHRLWQIQLVLNLATQGLSVFEIMRKAYCTFESVKKWIAIYKTTGLEGYKIKYTIWQAKQDKIKEAQDRLTVLIHEPPKQHGIHRTSWTGLALMHAYNKKYPEENCSAHQIRCYIAKMGFRLQASREMLTSPDPDYRKKIDHIQKVLQKLQPDEKFFSIDEYGPVGIRIKGGRTLRHKNEGKVAVPQNQKNKGYVICTAALELSTNQVTHFYSLKKNTFEMIKLVDLLRGQYKDQRKLYLSWDAASWHSSKILKDYVGALNTLGTPKIVFAPLPSCTQWLNVIESVFGGLARAVIHNSDYEDLDACKAAIDLHFARRNEYFKLNPKRPGNKIWGKETVKAKFDEKHITRNTHHMAGR